MYSAYASENKVIIYQFKRGFLIILDTQVREKRKEILTNLSKKRIHVKRY